MKLKDLFESTGKSVADLRINYIHGEFLCDAAGLTSLEGSPEHVTGDFDCNNNKLISLKDGPKQVDGHYYCYSNELSTLEGAPRRVPSDFDCLDNCLSSLEGGPEFVGGEFGCAHNYLETLEHAPKVTNGYFYCNTNMITSLKDVHKHIERVSGRFIAFENPIESHVLGLLLIKGITKVRLDNTQVEEILNRHLGKGRAGMLMAQEELIEAGLEEFAQL